MHQRLLFGFLLLFIAASCADKRTGEFRDRYRWITGKWEMNDEKNRIVEIWQWKKYRYEGVSYELDKQDTVFSELLYLEPFDEYDAYIAVIPGQNPVMFTAKKMSESQFAFINLEHDFPGVISYTILSENALKVDLSARISPSDIQLSYELKRLK